MSDPGGGDNETASVPESAAAETNPAAQDSSLEPPSAVDDKDRISPPLTEVSLDSPSETRSQSKDVSPAPLQGSLRSVDLDSPDESPGNGEYNLVCSSESRRPQVGCIYVGP